MSLNGLDSAEVESAHQTLLQESSRWFLLKYTSRDSVQMFAQGSKGLAEMRDAADAYYNDTDSAPHTPLYGMIHFRRRKILLKLVPEGTSRLIQARVQVHWNYITIRFANHDTLFESASTDSWNESALTAHIELHSSRSSSGSVKKPVLDGIEEKEEISTLEPSAEDASESGSTELAVSKTIPGRTSSIPGGEQSPALRLLISKDEVLDESDVSTTNGEISRVSVPSESPPMPPDKNEAKSRHSMALDSSDHYPSLGTDSRISAQNIRPSTSETYNSSFYDSLYKPKVKLGPRPSLTFDKRPGSAKGPARAVAALPPGLRASRQAGRHRSSTRPQTSSHIESRDTALESFGIFPPPPPVPESEYYMQRPTSSSNSVKSLPATLVKPTGMTREKQRLMRFRDMYKDKENKRAREKEAAATPVETESVEHFAIDHVPELNMEREESKKEATDVACEPHQSTVPDLPICNTDSLITEPEFVGDDTGEPTLPSPIDDHVQPSSQSIGESINANKILPDNIAMPSHAQVASSSRSALESSDHDSTRPSSISDTTDQDKAAELDVCPQSTFEATTPSTSTGAIQTVHASGLEELEKGLEASSSTIVEDDATVGAVANTHLSAQDEIVDDGSVTPKADSAQFTSPDRMSSSSLEPELRPRCAVVTPLSIVRSRAGSEGSYDDDLMDELDGAEVQEALTMSVSKSPNSPYLSRQPTMPPVLVDNPSPRNSPPRDSPSLNSPRHNSPLMSPPEENVPNLLSLPNDSAILSSPEPSVPSLDAPPKDSASRDTSPRLSPTRTITSLVYEPTRAKTPSPLPSSSPSPSLSPSPCESLPLQMTGTMPGPLPTPTARPEVRTMTVPKRMKIGGGVAAKIADLQRSLSRGSTLDTPSPALSSAASVPRKSSFMSSQRAAGLNEMPRHVSSSQMQPSKPGASLVGGTTIVKGSVDSPAFKRTPSRNDSSSSIGKLDRRRTSVYNLPPIDTKTETISVKATIIRTDGYAARPDLIHRRDSAPLQLHESPLVISHQMARSQTPVDIPPEQSPLVHPRTRSSMSHLMPGLRSSSSAINDPNSPESHRESSSSARTPPDSSWRMVGRRRSRSKSPARSPITPDSLARSLSSDSVESVATNESSSAKNFKTSGLRKRMSNSLSSFANASRLPLLKSTTVLEVDQEVVNEKAEEQPIRPEGCIIGDLNMQFPDTLLWKRRWVEIDNAGYIVLKPPAEARSTGGVIKKFHLNEFTAPFAPDLERQEMPNSVMMDFLDGRTLQCQTQNLGAQRHVLKILSDAHSGWA